MKSKVSKVTHVYASALKLIEPLTAEETFATIVQEAQSLVNAIYGSIFLYQNKKLQRVFSTVPEEFRVVPRKKGYSYQVLKSRQTLVIDVADVKKAHPEYSNDSVSKAIFIPLSHDKNTIGLISLDSTQIEDFTEDQIETLQLFGSLASLKLRNVSLIDELNHAIEIRDLFISMASHELKTPLTTVSAYAQLIERSLLSKKPVKVEWAKTLKFASGRMTRLINELLHVNQIRTGKMIYKFELIDPVHLIEQALQDYKLSYPQQLIIFDNQIKGKKVTVSADRDKLIQVVINLLTNADKFTEDDKEITLKLENKDNRVHIIVADRGAGIEKEHLDRLFQEFYKGKSTKEGLGLGLYISKKIVSAHLGVITIKSKLGKGTTVTVSLPEIKDD